MGKKILTWLVVLPVAWQAGCRVHPMSLAIDMTRELIGCENVSVREPQLVGKLESAADSMFGQRNDVLIDETDGERWIVYSEERDQFSDSFYVVTASKEGRITGLFMCRRNGDGLEDIYKRQTICDRVLGHTSEESEKSLGVRDLVRISKSQATGMEARFYDVSDLSHFGGARYCILCFDEQDVCRDVRMVAVSCQ